MSDETIPMANLQSPEEQDLQASALRIRELARRTAENIVEIGRELAEVKGCLKHGEWEAWVKEKLGWHASTAWRLMRAAKLASTQSLDIGDVWGNRRKRLAVGGHQDESLQLRPAPLHAAGEIPVSAALPAERKSLSAQQPPSTSLPLKEALERVPSLWRSGKGAPGAVGILSSDASGRRYLHLVGSSMHVQVGVTEPEVSFPCSHGEYLVDLQRTSPEGSSPGNGSQEQGGKGAASFSLSLATLEPALRLLRASASRHHTDGPLAGIFVRVQGSQVVFVASDGRRLWSSSFGAEAEGEGNFILPPLALTAFRRFRDVLHARFSPRLACLESGPVIVHSLLIRGPYPFLGQVPCPEPDDTVVSIEGRVLAQALAALAGNGAGGRTVTIRCAGDTLSLGPEQGDPCLEKAVPARVRGECHLLVEGRALLDFARMLSTMELRIKAFAAPLVLSSELGRGLLMPLGFQESVPPAALEAGQP